MPSTEDFEDEVDTATTFQVGVDPQFSVDGALAVGFASGFFAGGSDFGLDTYAAGQQSAGAVGSISIEAGFKFKVDSLKMVASDDYSVTFVDTSIRFTGTLADGGTETEVLAVNSSGGWQTLSFSLGLDGAYLTSLEIEILGATIDYVGIDDFEYTHAYHSVGSGGSGSGSGSGSAKTSGSVSSGSDRIPLNDNFTIHWVWGPEWMSVNYFSNYIQVTDDVASNLATGGGVWKVTHLGGGSWRIETHDEETLGGIATDEMLVNGAYLSGDASIGWMWVGDMPPDPLPADSP